MVDPYRKTLAGIAIGGAAGAVLLWLIAPIVSGSGTGPDFMAGLWLASALYGWAGLLLGLAVVAGLLWLVCGSVAASQRAAVEQLLAPRQQGTGPSA